MVDLGCWQFGLVLKRSVRFNGSFSEFHSTNVIAECLVQSARLHWKCLEPPLLANLQESTTQAIDQLHYNEVLVSHGKLLTMFGMPQT